MIPEISTPNAARSPTGDQFTDVLQMLDGIHKKISDLLNSYIPKARVNRQGTTKSGPVVAPTAGTRNAMSEPQVDQMKLQEALWNNRGPLWNETPADYQLRLQNKIAELTQAHRQNRNR